MRPRTVGALRHRGRKMQTVVVRSKYFPIPIGEQVDAESEPEREPEREPEPVLSRPAEQPRASIDASFDASFEPPAVVVFDTETTGLRDAHVLQLAYISFDGAGAEIERYNRIFKLLPGKTIDKGAEDVHKISMLKTQRDGVEPLPELESFQRLVWAVTDRGGRVIAHNADFDVRAVNTTMKAWSRYSTPIQRHLFFCSMKHSKAYSPLRDRRGAVKAFKNEELYQELFGSPPELGALHDALVDVRVTAANYFEAQRRGWW